MVVNIRCSNGTFCACAIYSGPQFAKTELYSVEMQLQLVTDRTVPMVPQTVAKIAICDYLVASGDCLVALITKLANVGGV